MHMLTSVGKHPTNDNKTMNMLRSVNKNKQLTITDKTMRIIRSDDKTHHSICIHVNKST